MTDDDWKFNLRLERLARRYYDAEWLRRMQIKLGWRSQ